MSAGSDGIEPRRAKAVGWDLFGHRGKIGLVDDSQTEILPVELRGDAAGSP